MTRPDQAAMRVEFDLLRKVTQDGSCARSQGPRIFKREGSNHSKHPTIASRKPGELTPALRPAESTTFKCGRSSTTCRSIFRVSLQHERPPAPNW